MHFFYLIIAMPILISAITIPDDSITAFDGKDWDPEYNLVDGWKPYCYGDDSLDIFNEDDDTAVIDSFQFEISRAEYDSTLSIGWTFMGIAPDWGQESDSYTKSMVFACGNPDSWCRSDIISINEYNSGKISRIKISPHESFKIYSPYFSETCSNAGLEIFVDCFFEPCESHANLEIDYFDGKIIIFSSGASDTIYLSCEKLRYFSSINRAGSSSMHKNHQRQESITVDLRGRRTNMNAVNKQKKLNNIVLRKNN